MSTAKPYELTSNKSLLDDVRVALLHGNNSSRISSAARQIANIISGDTDDALNTIIATQAQLKDNPGFLLDEGQSISMFGGKRIIWVKETAPSLPKQITHFLQLENVEAFLIVEAGQLTKSSPLRKICENSKISVSIACYDYTRAEILENVRSEIKANNLIISNTNLQYLIETISEDVVQIKSEIAKLVNYCAESGEIKADDIEALCSDPETASINEICDQLFTGSTKNCLADFHRSVSTGIPAAQILSRISYHIASLQNIHAAATHNRSIDMAMKAMRPPVFFKRQPSFKTQLNLWSSAALSGAARIIHDAIELARNNADIETEICERALLNLSMRTRNKR